MSALSNVALRSKLLVSFGLVLAVLVLLTSAAYQTTVANQRAADAVAHSFQVIGAANGALASVVDMETGYRGFLLTGDDVFLEPYVAASQTVNGQLAELRQLTAENPAQVARWDQIEAILTDWRTVVTEPGIALRRDVTAGRATLDDLTGLVGRGEGRRRFTAIRAVFREALASEEAFLVERQTTAASARVVLLTLLVVGTLVALGLGLFLALLLTRDLVGPVRRLATSAQRIADGDLRERVGLRRRDEIGAAALAFDQMADRLQSIIVRNQAILRTAAEGIVGLDRDGRVTFANPAAAAMLGTSADALLGRQVAASIAPGQNGHAADVASARGEATGPEPATGTTGAAADHPVSRALLRGTVERGSGDLLPCRDGRAQAAHGAGEPNASEEGQPAARPLPIEYVCAPIREADEIVGAVLTFRDVTERRAAEQALETRARELARSNADLEQFAYVASHDLQEPLRAVVSYLQLLERRYRAQLDERADRYIGHAVDGARRMQALINDLLTYSRVGRRGEELAPVDAEAMLDRVLASLRVAIEESGATVTHDPLPTVVVDATQFGQLLQNLVGNGIKFRGEDPPRVHVSAEREDDAWLFSVRDNGIGIAPEYRERVFVLFQRLHGRDEYAGTGIGLAVCKKIVERHGGTLWVESAPGGGSTFRFTIPDPGGSPP